MFRLLRGLESIPTCIRQEVRYNRERLPLYQPGKLCQMVFKWSFLYIWWVKSVTHYERFTAMYCRIGPSLFSPVSSVGVAWVELLQLVWREVQHVVYSCTVHNSHNSHILNRLSLLISSAAMLVVSFIWNSIRQWRRFRAAWFLSSTVLNWSLNHKPGLVGMASPCSVGERTSQ